MHHNLPISTLQGGVDSVDEMCFQGSGIFDVILISIIE